MGRAKPVVLAAAGRDGAAAGCAFILDDGGGDGDGDPAHARFCGAACQPGSAYCPRHHASCHLAAGSAAERRRLGEIEALARAVGGRQGRAAPRPPARALRRLDRLARAIACPDRSRIVLNEEEQTDADNPGEQPAGGSPA